MDHLPKALSSKVSTPSVPYLGSEFDLHYPKESQGWPAFKKFPETKGFDLEDTIKNAARCRKSAAFLQSWFFFGLLREVFARPNYCYREEDFVRTTEAGQIITTKALTRYVWYWQAASVHDERDAMESLSETIDQCLGLAHRIFGLINRDLAPFSKRGSDSSAWSTEINILCSIGLLGDFLSTARYHLRFYRQGPDLSWEFSPVEKILQSSGWCVGEISVLNSSCSLSNRYYLAGIDRNVLGKTHTRCNAEVGCLAYQLDYSTYRTSHHPTCDHQACAEVGPLQEDIVSAIRNGGTVVVDATDLNEGHHVRVTAVGGDCGVRTPYVAISHVWSNGLGNPWSNRLMLCQLRHVQKLVNSLYEAHQRPVPFWIDSLSIPVGETYAKERQLAITRIGQTFGDADKVLVLDNSMQLMEGEFEFVEALMRIRYSPWMSRVWTLLEGNLAPDLYFQFGDRVVDSDDLANPYLMKGSLVLSNALRELSDEELWSCPSAMQLVRALATSRSDHLQRYADMEEQSDPMEEELRQVAIQNLSKKAYDYEVGRQWRATFPYLDGSDELNATDEYLKGEIDVRRVCPVLLHAYDSIARVRGAELRQPRNGRGDDFFVSGARFEEACSGLRARTTSRLDDETLCLGALLGINLAPIVEIPTMGWRLREWLDALDCQRSESLWVRRLGINTRRFTEVCHLKRMEVLLSRVNKFPISMIFWNTWRLERRTWAPRSVLDRGLVVEFLDVHGRCSQSPEGLEVKISGFRLGRQKGPRQQPTPEGDDARSNFRLPRWIISSLARIRDAWLGEGKRDNLNETSEDGEILTIIPSNQVGGTYARPWCQVTFVPNDKTIASPKERLLTWQDYIDQGDIDNLAVIYRSELGALVRILKTENGTLFIQHIRLLKKALTGGNGPAVGGTFVNEVDWCFQ